jgi:glycosyltransferase involved in cell wall biosynthesis
MQVTVDGVIYERQVYGGIPRIYNEILPRMCGMDDSLYITLLTLGLEDSRHRVLPTHSRIRHLALFPPARLFRRRRLWWSIAPRIRALAQRLSLKNDVKGIWHSTYYTMLKQWDGPIVVTIADMIYERFAHLFTGAMNDQIREQKGRCVRGADAILCISETTKREAAEFYGIDAAKIHVTPLAYNEEVFGLRSGEGHRSEMGVGKPFLLYVGGRTHYKNFAGLLRAYSVWSRRKEVALVVVGHAWLKGERRLLAELGIDKGVHLFTDVDDESLCYLYNKAVAFIYPSLYEGFGIPLLEAMACGCPVIASRIPSTVEVAGNCPIYFEPTDKEQLLGGLDAALRKGRESEHVRSGLERVRQYSWDKTARRTLNVYQALSETG